MLKNLFIPTVHNNFRPTFLEQFSVSVMMLLVLITFAITNVHAVIWITSDTLVSAVLPAVIVELTNEERDAEEVVPLVHSTLLDEAAQLKAEHMAREGYFAHDSPDGITPWYWFDAVGYTYLYAGENLAIHFVDSADVVTAWMDSPGHRQNIMGANYQEIGVGTARGTYDGRETVFVVQLFGTRLATNAETVQFPISGEHSASNTSAVLAESSYTVSETPVEEARVTTASNSPQIPVSTDQTAESDTAPGKSVAEAGAPTTSPSETLDLDSRYSDLATTSRPGGPFPGGQPPQLYTTTALGTPEVGLLGRTLTQPHVLLQVVYGVLATIVVVALMFSVLIEWRRQHPVQVAYAGGLMVVMAILFYVHTIVTIGATIV